MRTPSTRYYQTGLSLIELMIALLISTILLLGVLTLFSNTTAQDRTNSAIARVQESARIGLEFIQRDLRRTSYLGCISSNIPAPTGTPTSAQTAISNFLTGMITGTDGGTGSDTLVTNFGTSTGATASNIVTSGVTLSKSIESAANQIFVISNCTDLAIIKHGTAGSTSTLTPSGNEYDPSGIASGSGVWGIQQASYDIRDTGRTNNAGNAISALYRNGEEIIEGAENLQVLYGITNGSNTTWLSATDLTNSNKVQIDRLKISLVIASPDSIAGTASGAPLAVADLTNPTLAAISDGRIRRVFNSTIDLRNRAYLRN